MILLQLLITLLIISQCEAALKTKSTDFWDATRYFGLQPFSPNVLLFQSSTKSDVDCARLCKLKESCMAFVFWDGGSSKGSCEGYLKIVFSETAEASLTERKSYIRKYSAREPRCQSSGVQILMESEAGLKKEVVCEDSWMVILRRQKGGVDFYRNWEEYSKGFGDLQGDFWFGLEDLHTLTSLLTYDLVIDLHDWEGVKLSATYTNFSLASKADNYRLSVDYVDGNANDSLSDHKGMQFTTYDRDNDIWDKFQCAVKLHAAWWYTRCASTNLFGVYKNNSHTPDKTGITWKYWHGTEYSLKFAQMKIRTA